MLVCVVSVLAPRVLESLRLSGLRSALPDSNRVPAPGRSSLSLRRELSAIVTRSPATGPGSERESNLAHRFPWAVTQGSNWQECSCQPPTRLESQRFLRTGYRGQPHTTQESMAGHRRPSTPRSTHGYEVR